MKIFGVSHIGNSRTNQEDNFLIGEKILDLEAIARFSSEAPSIYVDYTDNSDDAIIAISDGMGGHSSGEIASHLAVKCLCDNYSMLATSSAETLSAVISEINRTVVNAAKNNPEYKGMGATLCGFIYRGEKILGFNIGDSRLYRFDNGLLQQLSKDHSEGQRLVDLKLLSEEELKSFPHRKAIYKYIGMKTDLVADVFEISPCEKGTIFLLCTDGLTDVLSGLEIQEILNSDMQLKEKGEKMLNTALGRNVGHGDNITIILTEF